MWASALAGEFVHADNYGIDAWVYGIRARYSNLEKFRRRRLPGGNEVGQTKGIVLSILGKIHSCLPYGINRPRYYDAGAKP